MSADLSFQIAPRGLGPAVGTRDPSRGARVDPTVERLVSLPQLLPFEPCEPALGLDRDQLLADELLHPFRFGPPRQVHVTCRIVRSGGNVLVSWRRQAQEAVCLALECRDRDGPQTRPTAQFLAGFGNVNMRGARDRRHPIETLDTLNRRDLSVADLASPGIDGGRLVPGIDRELRNRERRAVRMQPGTIEDDCKFFPSLGSLGSAFDHDVIDEPAFETPPPGPHLDLDAVLLHVGPRRQEQATSRHDADLPTFAPLIEPLPIWRLTSLDPGLAKHAVLEAA